MTMPGSSNRNAITEKLNSVRLIIYDFDGVMTNNRVIVDETGTESVIVNRSDGYAVRQIEKTKKQIILSTETNPVVERRAEKLKIDVIHCVENKADTVMKYCAEHNINLCEIMFIGNDLNDCEAMKLSGLKGCPADAEPEIKELADWISEKNGGDGVVRDLFRWIQSANR